MTELLQEFKWIERGIVPAAQPLFRKETVQIAIIREVQDYTILRTEETRELNTVWTKRRLGGESRQEGDESPGTGNDEVERLAFLASKQKGAESRELEALLRSWKPNAKDCYLKSGLCMECPRCALFGATDVSGADGKGANIKHRIAYGTAFSLLAVEDLKQVHTFNGVDGATQLTGQTLGERESVRPGALFASIVTLRSATKLELVLTLKTILSSTRYGAESRIGGLVRNHVVGVCAGTEEIISPLELALSLSDGEPPGPERVARVLSEFRAHASTPGAVHTATAQEVSNLLAAVQQLEPSSFVEEAYRASGEFRHLQDAFLKRSKKKHQ